MSIFSQLLGGKISLGEAIKEADAWFVGEEKTSPLAQAIGTAVGNAAGLAGTAFGVALGAGVAAVEGWTNAALNTVLGGVAAGELTPSVDLALTTAEQQLVAAVQAEIAAFRSKLTPATTTTSASATGAPPAAEAT